MTDSGGRSLALTYLLSDAGKGLALLDAQNPPEGWTSCQPNSDWQKPAELSATSVMMGYPGDSDDILVSDSGHIDNLNTLQHALLNCPPWLRWSTVTPSLE